MTEPVELPKKTARKAPGEVKDERGKSRNEDVNYDFNDEKRGLASNVEKGQTRDSLAAHAEEVEARKLEADFERTIKKELKKPGQTPKTVFEGLRREIGTVPDSDSALKILAKLEGKYLDQNKA